MLHSPLQAADNGQVQAVRTEVVHMGESGYAESIQVVEREDGSWSWSATVGNRGSQRGTAGSRDEALAAARRAVEDLEPMSGPQEG